MIRHVIKVTLCFFCAVAFAQKTDDSMPPRVVEMTSTVMKAAKQCGMSISVPNLKSVSDQLIGFRCTGLSKDGGPAIMEMDFQYDPNFNARGGDNISFVIENIGLDERMTAKRDSVLRLKPNQALPVLSADSSYKESNCGARVARTNVLPVQGNNWHGWIGEETFVKPRGRCKPIKEYTSRYRCVHMMLGNDKMTAQLDGVCLLRKRELSLKNGFSYDLFMDMLKTLRFENE